MAREHARIFLSIWDDPDFLALPIAQQWTYFALGSSRYLSYCGVHPLVPAQIATLAGDFTERRVSAALHGLHEARFVVLDPAAAELVVRTYVFWDGILKQPNMVRAMNRAYERVVSAALRDIVLEEVGHAIARSFPDGIPAGVSKALGEGFAKGFAEGSSKGTSHSPSPFPLPPTASVSGMHSSSLSDAPEASSLRLAAGSGDA